MNNMIWHYPSWHNDESDYIFNAEFQLMTALQTHFSWYQKVLKFKTILYLLGLSLSCSGIFFLLVPLALYYVSFFSCHLNNSTYTSPWLFRLRDIILISPFETFCLFSFPPRCLSFLKRSAVICGSCHQQRKMNLNICSLP